jgi:tetratricopeptide (TPR) repeat protein
MIKMKTKLICLIIFIAFSCSCDYIKKQDKQALEKPDNTLIGKWVRIGPVGPISFDFTENGLVKGDFGNDQTIDVIANYEIVGDTIRFFDKEGKICQGIGQYKVYQTEYYLSFDLIDDECSGRIKTTMGFWTKPNFKDLLMRIDDEMIKSPDSELFLYRARIFLATGMAQKAKEDFDTYLLTDSLNARVFLNRAGTRFPNDLPGVVADCNKAISLEPDNKNAYFLRGLARYELGEKKQGCEDFYKAIELGFSVLRIAEQERCIEYWDME